MKLVNPSLELKAIYSICNSNNIKDYLIASLSESHFYHSPAIAAFNRLKTTLQERGDIMSWDELCNDPSLEEKYRKILKTVDTKKVKTEEKAKNLVNKLNSFRQLRELTFMAENILNSVKGEKVDINEVLDDASNSIATARTTSMSEDCFIHIGEKTNANDRIKNILRGKTFNYIPTGFEAFDRVNRGLPVGSLVTIAGTTGGGKSCCVGSSLVPTSKGVLSLNELWNSTVQRNVEGWSDIDEDIYVQSHDYSYNKIERVYRKKVDSTNVLSTTCGERLRGTKDHKFYTIKNNKIKFRKISNIDCNTYIAKSIGTNLYGNVTDLYYDIQDYSGSKLLANKYPKNLNKWLSILLGLQVSEGQGCFTFTNRDKDVVSLYSKCIYKLFGYYPKVVYKDGVSTIRLYDEVSTFLSNFMTTGSSATQYVPDIIQQAPKKYQIQFLRALFEGDGSVWCEKANSRYRIEYCTISKTLANDVKAMLENMGILCCIISGKTWATNGSDKQVRKNKYTIYIYPDYFRVFKKIGFLSVRKTKKLLSAVEWSKSKKNSRNRLCSWYYRMPIDDKFYRLLNIIKDTHNGTFPKSVLKTSNSLADLLSRQSPLYKHTWNRLKYDLLNDDSGFYQKLCDNEEFRSLFEEIDLCSRYIWTKVLRNDEVNCETYVYDLQINKVHSYSLCGVFSHNCLSEQLVINMARWGAKCCYVPLEMDGDEMLQRMLANLSETEMTSFINADKEFRGKDKTRIYESYQKYRDKLKKKGSLLSIFNPEEDMTIEDILYLLKPRGYRVIVIDYIGLLKGVGGDDSWQKLGAAARFAKVFAGANKCIVILCAQLSDEGQIKYSRAITEHSSVTFNWVYDETSKQTGIINIGMKKARNMKPIDFNLKMDFSRMIVRDVTEQEKLAYQEQAKSDSKALRKTKKIEGLDPTLYDSDLDEI